MRTLNTLCFYRASPQPNEPKGPGKYWIRSVWRGKYNRRPAELSGGQQQRVAVARAIVANPSIVLADEPTANLDSKTGERLLDLMRQMNQKRSVTFIFSTHDNMVMEYARRIVTIRDGRIDNDHTKSN